VSAIKTIRLSPRYWALATFFIPIAAAIAYGIWLVVSATGLAHSTPAENATRTGVLVVMSTIFIAIPRPWARAVAIAFAGALVLTLVGLIRFKVFPG
jgi:hypothetical protein